MSKIIRQFKNLLRCSTSFESKIFRSNAKYAMSCISYELIAQVVENTAFAKGYGKRELIY